jgi:hypothetical protein
VDARWEEVANSAVEQEQRDVLWGGVDYWFVMGTFHTRHIYGTVRLTTELQACIRASMFQIIISPILTQSSAIKHVYTQMKWNSKCETSFGTIHPTCLISLECLGHATSEGVWDWGSRYAVHSSISVP